MQGLSGSAETEVSTPFPAEALAGPTRGSLAAGPRPSGGRSPGVRAEGGRTGSPGAGSVPAWKGPRPGSASVGS